MNLHQLFLNFDPATLQKMSEEELNLDIKSICFDARQISTDSSSVFVAIKGSNQDGHQYISQAIANGAKVLVVEDDGNIPPQCLLPVFRVTDSREALDELASQFYNNPSHELFCFGVTGTNGKTSITYILEHILTHFQKPTGVMGTVNHRVGNKIWETQMTTPDAVTLQKRLREFLNEGAVAAALEVSSHALDQKRADSVHFNTVIFTNLTQDHLDYHKNMQDYFQSKQKLFTDLMWKTKKNPKFAVINIDDGYGRKLKVADDVFAWTYGQTESDFKFKILSMNFNETKIEIQTAIETIQTELPLCGEHTIYNTVAACIACLSAGFSIQQALEAMKTFKGVPGRLQKVDSTSHKNVFVDYAHTPDALENVLKSLQKIRQNSNSENRIITVFGCGGDRDKTKRPLMAEIAERLSDEVVITSDNPRTEDPNQIIRDIQAGLSKNQNHVQVEVDRDRAIQKAIAMAKGNDVVLIAGKGHEDYQIIGAEKKHFSDVEVAQKYLLN